MKEELEYLTKGHFCSLESRNDKVPLDNNMIQVLLLGASFFGSRKDSFTHLYMNLLYKYLLSHVEIMVPDRENFRSLLQ